MSTANERFKQLRKACGKTQEEWGKIIGITKNGICDIESGRRNVSDKHLRALELYKEKPINTFWVKDGSGDMFLQQTKNQIIANFVNEIMEEPDDSIKKQFIEMLSNLEPSDWETITRMFKLKNGNQ